MILSEAFLTPLATLALACALVAAGSAAAAETISDEAKVPAYTLPDPLVCQDGTRVADAAAWREKRRPELLRLFENEMYGRTLVPRPANLKFVVREEQKDARGGKATRLRVGVLFEGREDGRQMELLVYLPNNAAGRVPVFLGLNFDGNYTVTDEPDVPAPRHWAMGLFTNKLTNNVPTEAGRSKHKEQWQLDLALEQGCGVATAGYGEIEPDANDHWKEGPRGLGPEPGAGQSRSAMPSTPSSRYTGSAAAADRNSPLGSDHRSPAALVISTGRGAMSASSSC